MYSICIRIYICYIYLFLCPPKRVPALNIGMVRSHELVCWKERMYQDLPQFLMGSTQPIHVSRAVYEGSLMKYGRWIWQANVEFTPWKINMEPTNHPFRKENQNSKPPWGHVPAVNLQGCNHWCLSASEFDTWPTPGSRSWSTQEQLGGRTAMIYFGGSSQLFEVVNN